MKKIIQCLFIIVLSFAFSACSMSSCRSDYNVYFYNFKPESVDAYRKIIDAYQVETGQIVKMVSAASGEYESSLQAEMLKSKQPTLFQINGPVGYLNWKEYTLDLKNTSSQGYDELKLYANLTDKDLVVKDGDGVYGLPIAIEGYGLIYNKKVFNEYFSLSSRQTTINSIDEIDNFNDLKMVVDDMTRLINNKNNIEEDVPNFKNLNGVFVSTSLKSGAQWPYQTHLANIPLFFEFLELDANDPTTNALTLKEIEFKYSDNFQKIFDLYLNNSVSPKENLGDKSYDDSVNEFATGKAAIIQQGNWVYSAINDISNNVVQDDIGMIPIYTGIAGEEDYSIAIGTENFWCINKNCSKEQINATIQFMNWLFIGNGKSFITNDLGFIPPYSTFSSTQMPTNPLASEVLKYYNSEKNTIDWSFQAFPSEQFKNDFGSELLKYAQGKTSWISATSIIKEAWKKAVK